MRPSGGLMSSALGPLLLLPLLLLPSAVGSAATIHPGLRGGFPPTTISNTTATNVTYADHQLTSVQSFINSYEQGTTFNDTSLTGITGACARSFCPRRLPFP